MFSTLPLPLEPFFHHLFPYHRNPSFFTGTHFLQLESVLYYCYSFSTTGTLSLAMVPFLYHLNISFNTGTLPLPLLRFLHSCNPSSTTGTRPIAQVPSPYHWNLCYIFYRSSITRTLPLPLEPVLHH